MHATFCLPLPPCFPHSANIRLEEQLAKSSLGTDNAQGSRAHGQKRGRSPSPSPEPRGKTNKYLANHLARRGRRSPSPPRQHRQTSPPRDAKRHCTTKSGTEPQQFFRVGAAGNGVLSACTICLGRGPHDIYNCTSATLWDGSPAQCQKNSQGRIVNPAGSILCSDWQWPNGCSATTHDSHHECSGCGKSTHGAQNCPRAQKA